MHFRERTGELPIWKAGAAAAERFLCGRSGTCLGAIMRGNRPGLQTQAATKVWRRPALRAQETDAWRQFGWYRRISGPFGDGNPAFSYYEKAGWECCGTFNREERKWQTRKW